MIKHYLLLYTYTLYDMISYSNKAYNIYRKCKLHDFTNFYHFSISKKQILFLYNNLYIIYLLLILYFPYKQRIG